jgi:hypothetical protein
MASVYQKAFTGTPYSSVQTRFAALHTSSIMRTSQTIAANLLITIPLAIAQNQLQYSNSFALPGHNVAFDYVIVGTGTASLGIAYRLAEDGTKTVAVLEAGGFYEQGDGKPLWSRHTIRNTIALLRARSGMHPTAWTGAF